MTDIKIDRLKKSKGMVVLLRLYNNFTYTGKILGSDDSWVEILDFKSDKIMGFQIDDIKSIEVKE